MARLRHRLPHAHALLVAWLLALAGPALAQPTADLDLDREALDALGLFRSADVLMAVAPEAFVTLDGFHAMERAPLQEWTLFVDGQRHRHPITGAPDLNRLPIEAADLVRVRVYRAPHTLPYVSGSVHVLVLDTAAPRPGLAASTAVGNESGDPGPFRFTGDETTNVDKIGPDFSIAGATALGRLTASMSGVKRKHFATDPALLPRTTRLGVGYPTIDVLGARARLAVATGWQPALIVSASRSDDILYHALQGAEYAHTDTRARLSLSVQPRSSNLTLTTQATYAHLAATAPRVDGLPPARALTHTQARALAAWTARMPGAGTLTAQARLGLERFRVGTQPEQTLIGWQAGSRYEMHPVDWLRVAFTLRTEGRGAAWAPSFSAAVEPLLPPPWSAKLQVDASRRLAVDTEPEGYWAAQGLYGSGFTIDDVPQTIERGALTLGYTRARTRLAGTLSHQHRTHQAVAPLLPPRTSASQDRSGPPARSTTEVRGWTLRLAATHNTPDRRWQHRAAYQWSPPSAPFAPAGRPAHSFSYDLAWRFGPADGSSLFVFFRVLTQTETAWSRSTTALPNHATLPGFARIDLGLSKGFWSDRMRATARLENVLNDTVRYHPLGAQFDLGLYVSLRVRTW